MASSSVIDIATEHDFAQRVSTLPAQCLAVIYFHAPWAEPCKQMSSILSSLASTYPATSPPQIAFLALDAEELSEISEQYDVTQVPFLALQRNGKVLETVLGTDAAKIRTTVEKYAGSSAGAGEASKPSLPPAQQVTRAPESKVATQANGSVAPIGSQAPEETKETTKEELDARLSELVKAAPVMLFMKGTPSAPQCGFSRQCVAILRENGVKYGFFNILADDEVRQGLKEFSDWPTFPQIYVSGDLIGGLDILKEEFENDPAFLQEYSVQKAVAA